MGVVSCHTIDPRDRHGHKPRNSSKQLGFPAVSALGDAALLDAVLTGALLAGASAFMPGTASSEALKAKGACRADPCAALPARKSRAPGSDLQRGSALPLVAMHMLYIKRPESTICALASVGRQPQARLTLRNVRM